MTITCPKSIKIYITWLLRLLIGALFIFSGFTKAIDPWGTLFKVKDYLAVVNVPLWDNLQLSGVFALCALEFVIGIFILMGVLKRATPIAAALVMCFMLPFSLWIAINNPVSDCGCFGDAWHISNWATFIKNIFISAGVIWLLFYNKLAYSLITPALQWIFLVASIGFIFIIELFGYNVQPLIDFRKYKIGEYLTDNESEEGASNQLGFIYEKNGEQKIFHDNELPDEDEGWTFVKRINLENTDNPESIKPSSSKNFKIFEADTDEDVDIDDLIEYGESLIIMIPELSKISPAVTWKLNSLYDWATVRDVKLFAVISGSKEDIDAWDDIAMPSYPVYCADDTTIKEVVRGNPSIVFLDNGIIKYKIMLSAVNIDLIEEDANVSPDDLFGFDTKTTLFNCVAIYLACAGVLICLSFTPKLFSLIGNRIKRNFSHDDKARHEEL